MTDIDDGRYVGQQMRVYRRLRGYTQQYLADALGVSRTAITMYESGERPVDSRELLYGAAEALNVSVGDLTGHADDKVNPSLTAFHAAIPAIESALMTAGQVDTDDDPEPLRTLIDEAKRAVRLRADNDYASLGAALPRLITDLYRCTRRGSARDQAIAWEALTTTAFTAALTTKSLGYTSVGWNAARAAAEAATIAENGSGLAAAEYARAQVLLATPGALHASLAHSAGSVDRLQGVLQTASDLELYGMLHLHAALTSAALGKDPSPHLVEATEAAGRSGNQDVYGLGFGRENVGIWRMSVALELRDGRGAIEVAQALVPEAIPSVDRRSRYFIELGRAYALEGNYPSSMSSLLRAEHIAPQKVRSHTVVRELVGYMLRKARRDLVRGDLGKLAKRVGASTH